MLELYGYKISKQIKTCTHTHTHIYKGKKLNNQLIINNNYKVFNVLIKKKFLSKDLNLVFKNISSWFLFSF